MAERRDETVHHTYQNNKYIYIYVYVYNIFMLGCFLLDHPFYIDAFDRGRIRNPSEVASFLHSRDLHFSPQAFFPVTIADVLRRACRNLVDHHERSGNQESVRLFSSFGDEFDQAYRKASGQ